MRDLPLMLDIVLSALVAAGAAFALVGAWGLAKFRDFLKRLHGPTKASTVGVGAVLLASIGYFVAAGRASLHELMITAFVFMTAPVAAHMLVKAAAHVDPRLRPPRGPQPESEPTEARLPH
ncbi:MAG TPA: Na+/H+ antiporter subunit G [Burkholderiaceae bacterium]|nr:Na+/H+ antiporter subunit G [Burkholderiaceae bacterium]HQR70182.1 Na+/H+ antiporter subunit G [Burkholderiaceae bacterium]